MPKKKKSRGNDGGSCGKSHARKPDECPNCRDPFENHMTDSFRYAFWVKMGRPDLAKLYASGHAD